MILIDKLFQGNARQHAGGAVVTIDRRRSIYQVFRAEKASHRSVRIVAEGEASGIDQLGAELDGKQCRDDAAAPGLIRRREGSDARQSCEQQWQSKGKQDQSISRPDVRLISTDISQREKREVGDKEHKQQF